MLPTKQMVYKMVIKFFITINLIYLPLYECTEKKLLSYDTFYYVNYYHYNVNTFYFYPSPRCEVGTSHWTQCNDTPVKFARFPVTGLIEGRSYIFRVRAVNKTGISRPSRVSEPVAALDPADRARIRSKTYACLIITHTVQCENTERENSYVAHQYHMLKVWPRSQQEQA